MKFLIRADASIRWGTGHVHRMLALAEVLRNRGHLIRFWSAGIAGNMHARCRADGFEVEVAESETDTGGSLSEWVDSGTVLVVDHYALDLVWERAARPRFGGLVAVDDFFDRPHACDLFTNPGFGKYPHSSHSVVGPKFAMLRTAFAEVRSTLLRKAKPIETLLIFYGGVDQSGETGKAVRAIQAMKKNIETSFAVEVIAGSGNPALEDLRSLCSSLEGVNLSVDVTDMEIRMARADLCLGAMGSASWERCCLGLPTIGTVVADNQRGIADGLLERGAATVLGSNLEVDEAKLIHALKRGMNHPLELFEQSVRATALVDGMGCVRVAEAMETLKE